MPAAFVGQANAATSSSTLLAAIPGHDAGHLLLLLVQTNESATPNPVDLTGWSSLISVQYGAGNHFLYARIADGSEPATISITLTGAKAASLCLAYSGVSYRSSSGVYPSVNSTTCTLGAFTAPQGDGFRLTVAGYSSLWIRSISKWGTLPVGTIRSYHSTSGEVGFLINEDPLSDGPTNNSIDTITFANSTSAIKTYSLHIAANPAGGGLLFGTNF